LIINQSNFKNKESLNGTQIRNIDINIMNSNSNYTDEEQYNPVKPVFYSKNFNNNPYDLNESLPKKNARKEPKRFVTPEAYRNQLLAQMKEKKDRALRSRERRIKEELKYKNEQNKYYYFGREGGGAPHRDKFGHIIAVRGILYENAKMETQAGDYAEQNNSINSNNCKCLYDEQQKGALNKKLESEYRRDLLKQIEDRNSIFFNKISTI